MDFGQIIHMAQRNSQQTTKSQGSYFKAKLEPPKKESKEKKLSANIQKFLEQKKREDAEKLRQMKQKREELMAKRDTKEKNKIAKMLKVTKSANKSVLADAINSNETAITMEGPEQPDEDDYGYTSMESSNLYKKLMEKYNKMPEDSKFSKSSSSKSKLSQEEIQRTKQRVREAIMKDREEENGPHKRNRKSKQPGEPYEPEKDRSYERFDKYEKDRNDRKKDDKIDDKAKKKKLMPAPIVDFNQLLKLAEQKQYEPVQVEVPSKRDEGRLLTRKERIEMEEHEAYMKAKKQRERNRELGIPDAPPKTAPSKEPPRGFVNGKIPKLNSSTSSTSTSNSNDKISNTSSKKPVPSSLAQASKSEKSDKLPPKKPLNGTSTQNGLSKTPNQATSKPSSSAQQQRPSSSTKPSLPSQQRPSSSSKPSLSSSSSSIPKSKVPEKPKINPIREAQRSLPPSSASSSLQKSKEVEKKKEVPQKTREFPPKYPQKTREFPPKDVQKTREFPPRDLQKTREFPPRDLQKTREFPPRDLQRTREFPPKDIRRPSAQGPSSKKRRVIEDEDSEYDSEMDDFIDDGDEELDYSSEIKKIFGYDKSRYRDEDYDDRNMESNFSQVMREEFISKKIGLMEDLEDMRQEAMEKKMKTKKRRRID